MGRSSVEGIDARAPSPSDGTPLGRDRICSLPERGNASSNTLSEPSRPLVEPLLTARAVERAHILRALASTGGNKMAAAKILGLTRQSLQRRMIRHGIALPPAGNQACSSNEPVHVEKST